ncbi:MAG: efflux RND transporter permease subunit [Bdellovibrionota bacterium]
MSLSEFFIRRHVFTWMIMIGLIVFGLFSYQRVGISEFPDVDFPVVSISINREGSSPQLNEIEIADRVENALSSVQGIKKISSTSKTGSTEIVAEFDLDKDIDVAVQDVQSVLSRIQRQLPDDIDPPSVRKTNPEDSPIMWLGISSKKLSRFELMGLVRDQIQPKFSTVDGVADIFQGGYVEPNLRVWVDAQKLRRLDLSVNDLVSSIQAEHAELPAGLIEAQNEELNVRTYGEATTIDDFLKLPILKRGGSPNYSPIQMSDVVTAELGLESNRSLARAMGETSVGLGIRKQRGVNAVQVADNVKARLKEVQNQYKEDLNITVNFDTTTFIKEAIDELIHTLIFAAILTSIVCLIFLGSFAATVNVVLAIPTALIGAFIFVNAFGYTLNTFTLLALSMAVGIVVDDAIMVHENITRHESMGKKPLLASIDGGREIFFAVIATTFSLLAIFTPVAYVQGVIGKYLAQFGLILSVAVFLSMIEALTLTPMRYSQFKAREEALGKKAHDPTKPPLFERIMHPIESLYNRTLILALNYKISVIVVSVVIFLLSLLILKGVPKEFTPYQDVGRVAVMLRAPLGVSINYMDEKLKEIEAILAKSPSVERFFGFVGGGQVNSGRLFVTLKPKDQREGQAEVAKKLREELKGIKGMQVLIQDNASRGFSSGRGYPVEFAVLGPNFQTLSKLSEDLKKKMQDSGFMTDVDSNFREGLPEVQILPNRDAAALRGVSVADINSTIQAMIGGVVVGRYTQDAYRYDIRVRLKEDNRSKKEDILKLFVRNNRGEMIPLSDLVTLNQTTILQEITREDRQRAISLTANVAENSSQDEAMAFAKSLSTELPDGYQMKFSGSAEAFQETFRGLILAMILGILVTYMLLASQFNSFLQPMIILLAIPFSLSGAFFALLVFGQSINIYSMIGILLVLGLVLKNSIMLVDFTNKKREEDGLSVVEALKVACPLRLRPIIMTSLATIVGALPAALAIGPGAESRIPMALTIIGGMAISTFFTLYVVPCVYEVVIRDNKIKSS